MEALGKCHHQPLNLSLPRPSFPKTTVSFPFFLKTNFSKPATKIKTSFKSLNVSPKPSFSPIRKNPPKTLSPLSSLLKSISISFVAGTLFFAGFQKTSLAVPAPQPTVESKTLEEDETLTDTQKEKTLEEYLESHPDDAKALKALMEVKIKLQKIPQAIDAIDHLIYLQPNEKEWPLLRAHIHLYANDVETAQSGFEEIISQDPFRVEAYHGLAMAMSQSDPDKLEELLKRIENVMEKCKKEKKEDLRDFKLLIAQVRVIQGKYDDALKLYQQLVKEEPRDFRPYLCQGIIYTLMRKMDEAEKAFEKYRRLVPKGHPYAQYFNDNVLATKVFSQMAENQKAGSNR